MWQVDNAKVEERVVYYFGIQSIDHVLAEGKGLPPGSLLEISGGVDSGKTSVALQYCKHALTDPDTMVAWISTEAPLSLQSIEWAGIDPTRFLLIKQSPDNPGLTCAAEALISGCNIVVIDSIAALIDSDKEKSLKATLSAGLPTLKKAAVQTGGLVILTNQDRGTGRGTITISAGTSPALLRTMDYRIHLQSGAGIYRGGILRGIRVRFEVMKNREDIKSIGVNGRISIHYDTGVAG